MAFVSFTLAETAAKFFLRQAWFRKLKDNFDNLNARTTVLEAVVRSFDHFTDDDGGGFSFQPSEYDNATAPAGWTGTWFVNRGRGWMYQGYNVSARDGTVFNLAKPSVTVARIGSITSVNQYALLFGLQRLRFDRVGLPITFEGRFKFAADPPFVFGLRDGPRSELPISVDRAGIWLERVDASNWRFVSYDGTRNNGSNFAKPAAGNWFDVQIVFTNTPSNQALCYVDGVLKETLTAHLPTASDLCFAVLINTASSVGTGGVTDIDRVDFEALNHIDAA